MLVGRPVSNRTQKAKPKVQPDCSGSDWIGSALNGIAARTRLTKLDSRRLDSARPDKVEWKESSLKVYLLSSSLHFVSLELASGISTGQVSPHLLSDGRPRGRRRRRRNKIRFGRRESEPIDPKAGFPFLSSGRGGFCAGNIRPLGWPFIILMADRQLLYLMQIIVLWLAANVAF